MLSNSAKELWELDRKHHLHPWQHFDSFGEEGALLIDRAEGCYIYGAEKGERYFDAVGGLWCTQIGQGRKEMADAIAEQVMKLAYSSPFTDMGNTPSAELAGKLAEMAPGDLNHMMFTLGGSESNDTAYRLIQFYHRSRGMETKRHIISRKGSYHGSTHICASIAGKAADRVPEFEYISDIVHHLSYPNFYRAPEGMSEAEFLDFLVQELEDKIIELGPDNVAAFFAEPIMGAGGVIVPPKGYHKRTHEVCQKHDVLYVHDEVVTAFGRLGHWFASEDEFGIVPDIITCAKGLTSGYLPLGATIYSDKIHEVISAPGKDRLFTNGYTYSAHPVCCAAALKNLEIMEREDILANVMDVGAYFEERLQTLAELPIVGQVRGKKMMMCVENVANKETRELLPDEVNIGKRIANECDEMGLMVRPIGHLNVMSPPLIMTRNDVDFVVETLGKGISKVTGDLVASGEWKG
ncbi:MAG: aminotransferase [Alphaproteobacteria bacterium]|nr:aminotransferase [Alphaproteobacteria bacterium]